ncbi:MAG: hypothetical protein H0V66_14460 [Bdellovibrionales bacterium]|nr:hypothetical protein [Bdellovibrionales bacterium]
MTANTTLPPNHQWVETADGSFTLYSEAYQEACHSPNGARAETLLHYIQGCQIKEKIHLESKLSILEVGFGLGIGFLTTLDVLKDSTKPWSFLSLEIDENLLEWFRLENLAHPYLKDLKWIEKGNVKILECQNQLIHLQILCGDARKTLPTFIQIQNPKWNAIYQDAFSPKQNPVLWTQEWFEFLKLHSTQDVRLSTYSASSSIRKSLLQAGWVLHKGEKFGTKRTSTRATLTGTSDPEILFQLERSPTPALSDDNIGLLLSK